LLNFIPDILSLTKQLYPTGRAFKMPKDGWLESLHYALSLSENRAYNDAVALLYAILPDNAEFTEDDAYDWERRLGMITGLGVSLEDRKKAIKRKINHPGNIPARQHYLYIQGQLQAAGFDVYIHENRFFEDGDWVYKTPDEIAYFSLTSTQHGGDTQHGNGVQHGSFGFDVIANKSTPNETFAVGDNGLWATFFIGGEQLGVNATVQSSRLQEFKELVLKLKPAHTVAYTFISYV